MKGMGAYSFLALKGSLVRSRQKQKSRGRWPTFLSVLHGVAGNSAVSRAGWGQPAEDHRRAASLLGNGAVGGGWNTFGDRNQGQGLFLQSLAFTPRGTSLRKHDLTCVSNFYTFSTKWCTLLQARGRPGRHTSLLEILPRDKYCTVEIRFGQGAIR